MTCLGESVQLLLDIDADFVAVETSPLFHGHVKVTPVEAIVLSLPGAELLQLVFLANLTQH